MHIELQKPIQTIGLLPLEVVPGKTVILMHCHCLQKKLGRRILSHLSTKFELFFLNLNPSPH